MDDQWWRLFDQMAETCTRVRAWGPEYAEILDASEITPEHGNEGNSNEHHD